MIKGIIVKRGGKDRRARGKEVDENETCFKMLFMEPTLLFYKHRGRKCAKA